MIEYLYSLLLLKFKSFMAASRVALSEIACRYNLLLLGPPAAGKSSIARAIMQVRPEVVHLSAGNMIRQLARSQSFLSDTIRNQIKTRGEVSEDLVTQMVLERLALIEEQRQSYLLDGFPRNICQMQRFHARQRLVRPFDQEEAVLYCSVNMATAYQRSKDRVYCSHCDKNYNLKTAPPRKSNLCDDCNHELLRRDDDKDYLAFAKRWQLFNRQRIQSVLSHYKRQGKLYYLDTTDREFLKRLREDVKLCTRTKTPY